MKVLKYIFFILVILILADVFYRMMVERKSELLGNSVVLVKLNGIILDADKFISTLEKYKKNDRVKAFIVRIDSPGGAIVPSQRIFKYLKSMNKPVYAAMESVAASGGYYVAVGCNKIYAYEGTITGSIGVMLQLGNFQELLKKIGVNFGVIKSGKYKDIGSPYREMTDDEKSMLTENIMELYKQFVEDIKSSRNIDNLTLAEYTDGRIITGKSAVKLGFVDKIGSYSDAFNDLKKELKMENLTLFEHKEKKKFYERILEKLPFNVRNLFLGEGFYYLHQF